MSAGKLGVVGGMSNVSQITTMSKNFDKLADRFDGCPCLGRLEGGWRGLSLTMGAHVKEELIPPPPPPHTPIYSLSIDSGGGGVLNNFHLDMSAREFDWR